MCPRDGAGNYGLPSGNPVITNTVISSTTQNSTMSDVASALTQSLSRDGQTTPTADLTMGNFKLRNLAAAIARTDAVNAGQIQDNQLVVLSSVGGTGDAITASTAPAITVYTTDAKLVYTPTNANTLTNPTININGLGAKTITQSNGSGLWSGALVVGTPYELLYDGTNFRIQTGQLGGFSIVPQGQPFCMRNRFIDGNFDFWDSASSISLSGGVTQYLSTMYKGNPGGGSGAATVSRATIPPGADPIALESPVRYALQWAQTTQALTTNPAMAQNIEGVATFSGRSATFSCTLATTSGTLNITTVYIVQGFGSGGSPSAQVQTTIPVNWTVTTTPTRFSVRVDVPSISGKNLGTNGDDSISFGIQFPLATTFTIQTYQWQVEDCAPGATTAGLPTAFEFRGYAFERKIIDRYFQVFTPGTSIFGGVVAISSTAGLYTASIPAMRSLPSVTSNLGGGSVVMPSGTASSLSFSSSGTSIIRIVATLSGATQGQTGYISVTGGALFLDSRL